MASIPSWLWITAGWLVIVAGAWLLVTGRGFKVKAKGRHCQKCWYDMAGIETLKCPECGRVAASEKELGRRIHRQRWRTAGVVAAVVGWALIQMPGVIAHGWAAAVPGVVLARVAPVDLSAWAQANRPSIAVTPAWPMPGLGGPMGRRLLANPAGPGGTAATPGWGRMRTTTPPPPPPVTPGSPCPLSDRVRDALFDEMWRRITASETSERSVGAYLQRVTGMQGVPSEVQMPGVWAAGAAPPHPPRIKSVVLSGHTIDVEADVAVPARPASSMRVTILGVIDNRRYPMVSYDHPVDATRPRDSFMVRAEGAELNRAVESALAPCLVTNGNNAWIEADDRDTGSLADWAVVQCFVCVRARVLLNGKEIGHTSFTVNPPAHGSSGRIAALMAWEDGGEAVVLAQPTPAGLVIELTGDPGAAADQYLREWPGAPAQAWVGTLQVQARLVQQEIRNQQRRR